MALVGFDFRRKLTIDNTKVDAVLTDLPVLVKLDNTNFDFTKIELDGSDVRFTASDGITLLDFERENLTLTNGGVDVNTKLLLHMNGTDGSTTFLDSSINPHTITANGNAQIDTAESQFGGASGLFDGNSDYLTVPTSGDWDLDTSESWTIDFWIRLNSSMTSFQNPLHRALGGAPFTGWQMSFDGSGFLGLVNNTDSTGGVKATQSLTLNQWIHIAFVHNKVNDTLKIFIDGVEDNSSTASTAITWSNVTQPLFIGAQQGFLSTRAIDGWLDEVRISKDVARWTTNFTPPSAEYDATIIGGEAFYWVKVPTVSDVSDTDIFIYYGNDDVEDILYSDDLTIATDAPTKAISDSEFNASHLDDSAFDDNREGATNRWAADGTAFPHYIGWDFGIGNEEIVNAYEILPRNDGSWQEVPYDWTVEGSATGAFTGEEVTLDTRVNEVFFQNIPRIFQFASENTTAYRVYRILGTANQPGSGSTNMALTEIQLFKGILNPANTWNSDYKAVYHLKEVGNGTLDEFQDSTSNLNHGQGAGGVPTQVDSIIFKGQDADGSSEFITVVDRDDFFFDGDFTIEWKMRWIGSVTNGTIMGQDQGGGSNPKWFINFGNLSAGQMALHIQPGAAVIGFTFTPSPDTDFHCVLKRIGNDYKFFVDGVQTGGTQTNATVIPNVSAPFNLFTDGEGFAFFDGVLDEVRITKGIARSDAEIKALFNSDNNTLLTFGAEEFPVTEVFVDIDTDIRVVHTEILEDIDTDIRTVKLVLEDIDTDIRAVHTEILDNIDTDIRAIIPVLDDIDTDIRATHIESLNDINTDIRASAQLNLSDINTDIRVEGTTFKDFDTDIRIIQRKFRNIDTDIRIKLTDITSDVVIETLQFLEDRFSCDNTVTIIMQVAGAINMKFRRENEAVFSAFEPFLETKVFTLSAGDGAKSVFIIFQDLLGQESEERELEIFVETATPTGVTIETFEDETLAVPILDSVFQNDINPFFRWKVPVFTVPYTGFSYALDAVPDDEANIDLADVIESGLEVTKATPLPEMTLDISAGAFYNSQTRSEFQTGTLLLSDGGAQDRIDLIYGDVLALEFKVVEGTEAASPVVPSLPIATIAVPLAEVLVPAGTVLIANVTITDIRELYINITDFVDSNLASGVHTLKVKAITECDAISDIVTFNLAISNPCPDMGEILGFTDGTKTIQLVSNTYQTVSSSIFLEWAAAPNEPGPITYHFTTDGSEPTLASPSTTGTTLNLGPFSEGITRINIKPFDDTSGNTCLTKNFIFVFGSTSSVGDTLVIGNGLTLKQSLKEVQVKSIAWNFDSARICQIYQSVNFDSNLQFSLNDDITVVHNGETLFSGRIRKIERSITISGEGVTYICTGPRGTLTECFAVEAQPDGTDSAIVDFEEVDVGIAVTQIASQVPSVIKSIQSLPTSEIKVINTYRGKTISQVLKNLYLRTEFGFYIKPDGTLVSVSKNAINSNNAKFGVFGTKVSSISPQFNVINSNLQFDVSARYNKAIIEGSNKLILKENVHCRCLNGGFKLNAKDTAGLDYSRYAIDSEFRVAKVISTSVDFTKLRTFRLLLNTDVSTQVVQLRDLEVCVKNKITRKVLTGTSFDFTNPKDSQDIKSVILDRKTITTRTFPQGSLAGNNIVSFPEEVANLWFRSFRSPRDTATDIIRVGHTDVWGKFCGTVRADILLETIPLRAEVSVSGTADSLGAKTLRIVDKGFKFSEDPDNPIDDTQRMIDFATERLDSLKNVKINGTITLDTIDSTWTLDNTVNLINTAQGAWTSLNIKVIGISYNFDENTTTLELTTEFLK